MKRLFLMLALLAGAFAYNTAQAQVSVNISVQPIWGPTGFDQANYYYFPDIEAYYDVNKHQFVYQEGSRWVFAAALPARFGNFDLYHSYKVVINDPKPYLHHATYKAKYASYKGHHDQPVIRDSHEQKYYVIKDHPDHNKYKEPEHNNGHERR